MTTLDLSNLPILLVDDEAFIRSLVMRMLNEMGYQKITQAADGVEASKALLSATPPIAAIILDLEMPNVGGFEFLKFVRNAQEVPNKKIPIVVLTGHSNRDNIIQAAKLGIHGFLVKPVSKTMLDKKLKHALTAPMIDPALIPNG
ncbi:response regulator [Magnetovibrio sp. PR-2]|uniref:response regulator n=1 Tax=Magnetovibrio sp. PR-2 TaxID=3120356 RepID=UPI002FCDF520